MSCLTGVGENSPTNVPVAESQVGGLVPISELSASKAAINQESITDVGTGLPSASSAQTITWSCSTSAIINPRPPGGVGASKSIVVRTVLEIGIPTPPKKPATSTSIFCSISASPYMVSKPPALLLTGCGSGPGTSVSPGAKSPVMLYVKFGISLHVKLPVPESPPLYVAYSGVWAFMKVNANNARRVNSTFIHLNDMLFICIFLFIFS